MKPGMCAILKVKNSFLMPYLQDAGADLLHLLPPFLYFHAFVKRWPAGEGRLFSEPRRYPMLRPACVGETDPRNTLRLNT